MIGITLLVFAITRFAPGGPMERMLQQMSLGADQGGKASSTQKNNQAGLSEDQIEALEEQYGMDKPMLVAYCQWLGIFPREANRSKAEFGAREADTIGDDLDPETTANAVLRGSGRAVRVVRNGAEIVSAKYVDGGNDVRDEGWKVRFESAAERKDRFITRNGNDSKPPNYSPRAIVYRQQFSGLLQGNLGNSMVYQDSVWEMIISRVPVATYFGILTALITYLICIPLGIIKALRHRSWFDSASSILIFIGYSVPGFALGAILLVHLGARLGWFPLFGVTSPDFNSMDFGEKILDLAHHTVLPLICYLVGSFAMMTMMTKNNLMDHLASDYVRTAVAKGASYRRAVVGHALRNSMIPLAAGIGGLISVFMGGSMLVERVFDIQGFGLLQYQAVIERDVPVIMGTLVIGAFLMLIGQILSDIALAIVDPRVKYDS